MYPSLPPRSVGSTLEKVRDTGAVGRPDATVTRSTSYPGAAPAVTESYSTCTSTPLVFRPASDEVGMGIAAPTCVLLVEAQAPVPLSNSTRAITSWDGYAEPTGAASTRKVRKDAGRMQLPLTDRELPDDTACSCSAYAVALAPLASDCTTNAQARFAASLVSLARPPSVSLKDASNSCTPRRLLTKAEDMAPPKSTWPCPPAVRM